MRRILMLTCVAGMFAGGAAWGAPKPPAPAQAKEPPIAFADEAVKEAIERAKEFLLMGIPEYAAAKRGGGAPQPRAPGPRRPAPPRPGKRAANRAAPPAWGKPSDGHVGGHAVGVVSLMTYALLESGVSPQAPYMRKILDWLSSASCAKTYSLGVRCNVWLAADQLGQKYHQQLADDVQLLIDSTSNGGYNYDCKGKNAKSAGNDNSASQYALLGVWAGARAGVRIAPEYWKLVFTHWTKGQGNDGGWPYRVGQGNSSGTMTAAGLASLYVCYDNLLADQLITVGSRTHTTIVDQINRGTAWFDKHFANLSRKPKWEDALSFDARWRYYFLYGIERVGLASGTKFFGDVDWYRAGAAELLRSQHPDGGWGGRWDPRRKQGKSDYMDTSFALLFLLRGQRPVLFNKLRYGTDRDWNKRPRDMASLTGWISKVFERGVNWQIVGINTPVSHWHDAPILYITGSGAPKFSRDNLANLREFVMQGGAIFCTGEVNPVFRATMRKVYKELFPDYELVECKPDHPIYTTHRSLHHEHSKGRVKVAFQEVNNGVRPLVVHTNDDLSASWQEAFWRKVPDLEAATVTDRNKWRRIEPHYQAAANLYQYVSEYGLLRNRGVELWPKPLGVPPKRTIQLARLRHGGSWDPEPLAYKRFALLMANRTQTKVDVLDGLPIERLADSQQVKLASLTGVGGLKVSKLEQEMLKKFVSDGGMLVVDAAAGNKQFAEAAELMLQEMYDVGRLRRLSSRSDVFRLDGYEIPKVRYRLEAKRRLGVMTDADPNLRVVITEGERAGVIYSPEDLTVGLLGCPAFGCAGYMPESAFELMRNITLIAAGILDEAKPKPAPPRAAETPKAPKAAPRK